MKKGKIINMPTTIEAQIRTRARNLPLDRCMVNSDWEDTQMVNLIVNRKHVNGNITFGMYLVDLMLLGVKDCFYEFNVSPNVLEERIKAYTNDSAYDIIDCDYELAHNIIYEGIDFAEEYGFKPCKEFTKTAIYIMEEDSDDIPSIYIPLGEDGVPVVFVDPWDNRSREISILEKTAGYGNYIVYNIDEDGNVIDDDDDDDDDFESIMSEYNAVLEEIEEIGVDNYIAEYADNLNFSQTLVLSDLTYKSLFDISNINKTENLMDLIFGDNRFDYKMERQPKQEKNIDELTYIFEKCREFDYEAALEKVDELLADDPDDVDMGLMKISLLNDLDRTEEEEELVKYWYEHAGNNHNVRLMYAEFLIEQERFNEVFEMFGNQPGLNAITTDDVTFTIDNIIDFCACYVMAWLSKNNIEEAEPYYRILLLISDFSYFGKQAMSSIANKKKELVMKKLGLI